MLQRWGRFGMCVVWFCVGNEMLKQSCRVLAVRLSDVCTCMHASVRLYAARLDWNQLLEHLAGLPRSVKQHFLKYDVGSTGLSWQCIGTCPGSPAHNTHHRAMYRIIEPLTQGRNTLRALFCVTVFDHQCHYKLGHPATFAFVLKLCCLLTYCCKSPEFCQGHAVTSERSMLRLL